MDDGVDAEVIYGILGSASKLNDAEASEMLRIYNDWLKEFCKPLSRPADRTRLPALWRHRRGGEGNPTTRRQEMGLGGLELSMSWDMVPMWHPDWEKLWKAVSDVDLPLHFHTFRD